MEPTININITSLIDRLFIESKRNELKELEDIVVNTLLRAVEAVPAEIKNSTKAKLEVKHNGHTLITADSIKELQAKVNYEKEMLGENEQSVVVYSAVVSSFSIT